MSALAEIIVCLTLLLFGGLCLWLTSKKQEAVAYPIIATVVFASNMVYSSTIPFETDTANIMLIGLNMMLMFIALLRIIVIAFEVFNLRRS